MGIRSGNSVHRLATGVSGAGSSGYLGPRRTIAHQLSERWVKDAAGSASSALLLSCGILRRRAVSIRTLRRLRQRRRNSYSESITLLDRGGLRMPGLWVSPVFAPSGGDAATRSA